MSKNRSQSVLPFDYNRVILTQVPGHGDISYINASLIKVQFVRRNCSKNPLQGYFFPYILTQDPLSSTVWDFWRMINEREVYSIVTLCNDSVMAQDEQVRRLMETENTSMLIALQFWPNKVGDEKTFGPSTSTASINVKLLQVRDYNFFQLRTMQVRLFLFAMAMKFSHALQYNTNTTIESRRQRPREVCQYVFMDWPSDACMPFISDFS